MPNIHEAPSAADIKQAYAACLTQPSLDIMCLSTNYQAIIGDYFDEVVAPQLYHQLSTREILPDTPANRAYAQEKDATRNQIRFIRADRQSQSDLLVGPNLAALISFGQTPGATLIKDQERISSLAILFETAWQTCSE